MLDKSKSTCLNEKDSVKYFFNTCNFYNLSRAIKIFPKSPILLRGEPGVGKTSLLIEFAKALNIDYVRINLSDQTEFSDLVGSISIENNFQFVPSKMINIIEKGGFVIIDEINLCRQSVLEGLNSLLDFRQSIIVNGRKIKNKARIFGTMNSASYNNDRKNLPASFLNRFIILDFKYTKNELLNILGEHIKYYDGSLRNALMIKKLGYVRKERKRFNENLYDVDCISKYLLERNNEIVLTLGTTRINVHRNFIFNYCNSYEYEMFYRLLHFNMPIIVSGGQFKYFISQFNHNIFYCHKNTEIYDFIGTYHKTKENKFVWEESDFIKFLQEDRLLVLYFPDMMMKSIFDRLNSIFDERTFFINEHGNRRVDVKARLVLFVNSKDNLSPAVIDRCFYLNFTSDLSNIEYMKYFGSSTESVSIDQLVENNRPVKKDDLFNLPINLKRQNLNLSNYNGIYNTYNLNIEVDGNCRSNEVVYYEYLMGIRDRFEHTFNTLQSLNSNDILQLKINIIKSKYEISYDGLNNDEMFINLNILQLKCDPIHQYIDYLKQPKITDHMKKLIEDLYYYSIYHDDIKEYIANKRRDDDLIAKYSYLTERDFSQYKKYENDIYNIGCEFSDLSTILKLQQYNSSNSKSISVEDYIRIFKYHNGFGKMLYCFIFNLSYDQYVAESVLCDIQQNNYAIPEEFLNRTIAQNANLKYVERYNPDSNVENYVYFIELMDLLNKFTLENCEQYILNSTISQFYHKVYFTEKILRKDFHSQLYNFSLIYYYYYEKIIHCRNENASMVNFINSNRINIDWEEKCIGDCRNYASHFNFSSDTSCICQFFYNRKFLQFNIKSSMNINNFLSRKPEQLYVQSEVLLGACIFLYLKHRKHENLIFKAVECQFIPLMISIIKLFNEEMDVNTEDDVEVIEQLTELDGLDADNQNDAQELEDVENEGDPEELSGEDDTFESSKTESGSVEEENASDEFTVDEKSVSEQQDNIEYDFSENSDVNDQQMFNEAVDYDKVIEGGSSGENKKEENVDGEYEDEVEVSNAENSTEKRQKVENEYRTDINFKFKELTKLKTKLQSILEMNRYKKYYSGFKTGKKLDIKKVVDFIASNYTKDRIWMRRSEEDERDYVFNIFIDDTKSMMESNYSQSVLAICGDFIKILIFLKIQYRIYRFSENITEIQFSDLNNLKFEGEITSLDWLPNFSNIGENTYNIIFTDGIFNSVNFAIENTLIVILDKTNIKNLEAIEILPNSEIYKEKYLEKIKIKYCLLESNAEIENIFVEALSDLIKN